MHKCCRKNSERLCCHSGHYAAGRQAPTFCFSHIFCQSVSAGPDQDLAEQTKGSHGLDKYLAFSCVPFAFPVLSADFEVGSSSCSFSWDFDLKSFICSMWQWLFLVKPDGEQVAVKCMRYHNFPASPSAHCTFAVITIVLYSAPSPPFLFNSPFSYT